MTALETRITPANARSMALKSWESRRKAEAEKAATPQQAEIVQKPSEGLHARELERLKGQMDRIDDLLESAVTAAEWRDFTNARARLFDQWTQLAGIPKPGSRRPGKEPTRRQSGQVEPLPTPTQQVVNPPENIPPCATTGSEPA